MSTATYDVTNVYTDLVATIAAAASTATLIQNVSQTPISVIAQASGSAPDNGDLGVVLMPFVAVTVNAAQIHVKAHGASAKLVASTVMS